MLSPACSAAALSPCQVDCTTTKGPIPVLTEEENPRKPSRRLAFEDAVQIWLAVWDDEFKNRIAARFDCNVARVYDVLQGRLHPGSKKVAQERRGRGDDDPPPPPPSQPSLPL